MNLNIDPVVNPQPDPNDVQTNKTMGILAYILFFLPLLAARDSQFAMYHANQGLLLLLTAVAANFVLGIIPILGWILLPFANIAIFILLILGIVNAANGQMKQLPLIGNISLLK
ncbi:DUF4870 domain-containing protein [Paenibacillus pini]|uniref:DUF4870 domain-containing protein n=1 Tax=Paenibacillus pini JCM 16418 TaxID=1236976 RepID=W7YEB6_9BACL|nr:hypothetical protein [Paenibacillus pini]GAF09265.1 hypothetical protein JCM16418_3391 [Paenibacillus pini JCM 16418]